MIVVVYCASNTHGTSPHMLAHIPTHMRINMHAHIHIGARAHTPAHMHALHRRCSVSTVVSARSRLSSSSVTWLNAYPWCAYRHARMRACVRAYRMHACMHACMHARMHGVPMGARACMHPCVRACMHVCVHSGVHVCLEALRGQARGIDRSVELGALLLAPTAPLTSLEAAIHPSMSICVRVRRCACAHICMYMHARVRICMRIRACVCACLRVCMCACVVRCVPGLVKLAPPIRCLPHPARIIRACVCVHWCVGECVRGCMRVCTVHMRVLVYAWVR